MARLNGKTALITGGTSGIGLGIATALAAQGAKVIINGLGRADDIRSALDKIGHQARHVDCDMSDPIAISQMMSDLGAIDILINNAGVQHVAPVDAFPTDQWDRIIAINLSAVFHTTRAAVGAMRESGWGRVINIASAHGLVASPYKSAYVAAKHGVLGFTKSIALELAQSGVTVNAISPGYVLTPLVENQIPDTAAARNISEQQVVEDVILANQPTKRFVTIEEVAACALFLCTDGAASITGTSLSVDGGWTAQ